MQADKQISGAAGEFLTAGKLFKLGFQVGVTFGNAKAIDLLVMNPVTQKQWAVQVKTNRSRNWYLAKRERINRDDIWVFVQLNAPHEAEDFFVVPGSAILDEIDLFFWNSYQTTPPASQPAINPASLLPYKNNWSDFS